MPGIREDVNAAAVALWGEDILTEGDAVKALADKIRKTPDYKMGIGRATALYMAQGDYKAGEAHKMALHLVSQQAKKFYGAKYFEVYTPEVRLRVQKRLAAMAREDASKLNHLLPKKYQKGFDGYDEGTTSGGVGGFRKTNLGMVKRKKPKFSEPVYEDVHWHGKRFPIKKKATEAHKPNFKKAVQNAKKSGKMFGQTMHTDSKWGSNLCTVCGEHARDCKCKPGAKRVKITTKEKALLQKVSPMRPKSMLTAPETKALSVLVKKKLVAKDATHYWATKRGKLHLSESLKEAVAAEDKKVLQQLNKSSYPEKAEKGKGYCFHWADGRGICGFKTKTAARNWLKRSNGDTMPREVVKFWYGEPKYGKDKKKSFKLSESDVQVINYVLEGTGVNFAKENKPMAPSKSRPKGFVATGREGKVDPIEEPEPEIDDETGEEIQPPQYPFTLNEIQAYYDVQIALGKDPIEGVRNARKKFQLKDIRVNPVGEILPIEGLKESPKPPPPPPEEGTAGEEEEEEEGGVEEPGGEEEEDSGGGSKKKGDEEEEEE